MNALRFGEPGHEKTRHLVYGVVAGVGGYGNAFGVPVVGGEVEFDPSYNGNCLVNAFAAGLADTERSSSPRPRASACRWSISAPRPAATASAARPWRRRSLMTSIEEKRPTVQVGDPFTEKCLLEACLELMASGAVIAIQDMGAAGLTCSAVEMGAKGDLGIVLDLDKVPVREENMTPYEMMLSESQERMLMVLRPEKEAEARGDVRANGASTSPLSARRRTICASASCMQGEEVANLPIKELGDEAPEYDRPWVEPKKQAALDGERYSANGRRRCAAEAGRLAQLSPRAAGSGSSMTR